MSAGRGELMVDKSSPSPASMPGSGGRTQTTLSPNTLTTAQKAALIIAALGPDSAGPIIERIGQKHLRAFAHAYAHLHTIPRAALKVVIEEFVGRLSANNSDDLKGGYEETRELLGRFMETEEIAQLMDGINAPGGLSAWEKLDGADDVDLAGYLGKQNAQVAAIVLSKINMDKASRILDILDDEVAQSIISRLAKPMEIKPEVLEVLSKTIERDFLTKKQGSSKGRNPGEAIGAMMNNLMSVKRDKLLAYIAANVPDILADVKKALLTFQDIPDRVPPNAVPMVVKEMELDLFLQAAKLGRENAPASVDFIFSNISQRMRQQYEEQMEKLKPIPLKDAEGAQATFMTLVRKLAASGDIELNDIPLDDEEESAGEGGEES